MGHSNDIPSGSQKKQSCGLTKEAAASKNNPGHQMEPLTDLVEVEIETNLQLLTLRISFRFATSALDWSFKGTQTTNFVKNSFLI